MGSEVLDFCKKYQAKGTQYVCYHGISNSIPCPSCFRLDKVEHPCDRTRDWEGIYSGGQSQPWYSDLGELCAK